jgi:hypothetical protein
LLPSIHGWISEAAHSCVAWIHDGQVYTPSSQCDALSGTTIQSFFDFCSIHSIPINFTEQPIRTINPQVEWLLFNARKGCFVVQDYNTFPIFYSSTTSLLIQKFNDWRLDHAKPFF